TACRLRRAMPGVAPPLRDSSLVAPEGHRKQLVGTSKTLEPFNRDKSVHILQLNTQTRGVIQVVVLAAAGGAGLEDDGDHGDGPNWDSRRRQRIRNDRIVGYCFERVAYGPATILVLGPAPPAGHRPPFLQRRAAMNLAHRSSAVTTETADMLIIDRPD